MNTTYTNIKEEPLTLKAHEPAAVSFDQNLSRIYLGQLRGQNDKSSRFHNFYDAKTAVFGGRSVIIGSVKIKSYQHFLMGKHEALSVKLNIQKDHPVCQKIPLSYF